MSDITKVFEKYYINKQKLFLKSQNRQQDEQTSKQEGELFKRSY